MSREDANFLGRVIDSCYQDGLRALKNGDWQKAKKLLLSAAEKTLLLAKGTVGEERTRLIERADEICAFADAIAERGAKEESAPYAEVPPAEAVGEKGGGEQMFVSSASGNLTFDDVIGLDGVKDEIRKLAIYPREYPELYAQFKKKRGGGILLYGVPGTGKTMIANAIANELGAAFYPVKCSDILSKWFGEAEQNIKALFEEAGRNPVSVVFFDEFDSLGTKRDTDSASMKRIIPELLVEIQKAEESENMLIVIAATNRPWDIDSAFLRPGRFKLSICVPLPDAKARKAMIDAIMAEIPHAEDLDMERIVMQSEGFSGADVVELCEQLKDCAIARVIHGEGEAFITNRDVSVVFETVHSSVNAEDLRAIETYREQKSF